MCIRTGHFDAVNQAAVLIYADMSLISEMPCIAFLHLMRIRIPFLLLVFGGRWGLYDSGIHNRSLLEDEALFHKALYHLSKYLLLNAVLLKDMPKPSQRISVRHLVAGINAAKLRKRAAVYDLCHGSHIREVIQILKHIDPQHQFQIVGLVSALSFVIARLNLCDPFPPRNDAIYLRKEFFFLRPYIRQFIAECGQCYLLIHRITLPHFLLYCTPLSRAVLP